MTIPTPRLDANVAALAAFTGVSSETNLGFNLQGLASQAGQNTKTLTILAFAKYAGLTIEQTLPLFGEAFDQVMRVPFGSDHQNIRMLMTMQSERVGLEGVYIQGEHADIALRKKIDALWECRSEISPVSGSDVSDPVEKAIGYLNSGIWRVAFKLHGYDGNHSWFVDQSAKKAVLLYFKLNDNRVMRAGDLSYWDKVPTKFEHMSGEGFREAGVRVVPPAVARRGSYIAKGVILMPSYVNIGAHVGGGTMVDTWATVSSGAQIGKNVHLSGGVGIGGVLEPVQANPTIIEDNCFIGARSEVVEGVIVGENSVLSMGVFLGQSTKIYDRETGTISSGYIPPGSVVVPGSLPSADGKYSLYCAVIIKRVDAQTRAKTSLNDLLRD